MTPPFQLTPEQKALSEKRRAERAAKKSSAPEKLSVGSGQTKASFLKRDWISLDDKCGGPNGTKILSWNLLAQTLVRRKLFPGSDCLKWTDRQALLCSEMSYYSDCDIICLQECDKLPSLISSLPSHVAVQATGPGKSHGLVILYSHTRFSPLASTVVHLDFEDLNTFPERADSSDAVLQDKIEVNIRQRRGGSRYTKNIGLIVGLSDSKKEGTGIIVATTHLFWHPIYAYERTRQALLLTRAIRKFQRDHGVQSWPVVLAGDLNTQPSETTYHLLTQPFTPLPRSLLDGLTESLLVHNSVDKIPFSPPSSLPSGGPSSGTGPATASEPGTGTSTLVTKTVEEKEEDREDKKDDSAANTRSPTVTDGLPTAAQLVELFQTEFPDGGARSIYGTTEWARGDGGGYGERLVEGTEHSSIGAQEPAYTCYTPLFKLTLDYLLILPPISVPATDKKPHVTVRSVLKPAKPEQLGEGLPRKGICASDHLAVGCELIIG